jgi:hypothetical protein
MTCVSLGVALIYVVIGVGVCILHHHPPLIRSVSEPDNVITKGSSLKL